MSRNQEVTAIHNVLNKNHKQLTNQIDAFSINLHQHQQQLKSILKSINQLVTFLQNEQIESPNNQNVADELSEFSSNLQKKLELIAQCISNIESDQLQSLQHDVINALTQTKELISSKIDEKHKSLSIMNTTDLNQQSKYIINCVQTIIENIKIQHNKNENIINPQLFKQINVKLSNIDLRTKVLNEEIQQIQNIHKQLQQKINDRDNKSESLHSIQIQTKSEQNILNKITDVLPDIISNAINDYFQNHQNHHNQHDNDLNMEIEKRLSLKTQQMSTMSINRENKPNEELNNKLNTVFKELQYIEQIGKENDKNNLIILNKLCGDYQTIQTQLQNIQQVLSKSFHSFQSDNSEKLSNSDPLSINVFLNRMNDIEQRLESKLSAMSEQQNNFQKCVLEQLNQLISTNDINKLSSMQMGMHRKSFDSHKEKQNNNLSLWMTVQQIDRNTKELNKKMELLKEQQIAQFESITNELFKQKETLSFTTNNIGKYIKESVSESINVNKNDLNEVKRLSYQTNQIRNRKSLLQPYRNQSISPNLEHSNNDNYNKHDRSNIDRSSIDRPNTVSISRKYSQYQENISMKPSMFMDDNNLHSNNITITDCDDLITWSKMDSAEKKQFCNALLKRLFSKELYQHTVEPRNSFYLQFAKKVIEDWKEKNKWNDENWELMDEKKQLISKMWSFMLLNWNECVSQT